MNAASLYAYVVLDAEGVVRYIALTRASCQDWRKIQYGAYKTRRVKLKLFQS